MDFVTKEIQIQVKHELELIPEGVSISGDSILSERWYFRNNNHIIRVRVDRETKELTVDEHHLEQA